MRWIKCRIFEKAIYKLREEIADIRAYERHLWGIDFNRYYTMNLSTPTKLRHKMERVAFLQQVRLKGISKLSKHLEALKGE